MAERGVQAGGDRHEGLRELLDAHPEEHGGFNDIEMTEARELLYGEPRLVDQSKACED